MFTITQNETFGTFQVNKKHGLEKEKMVVLDPIFKVQAKGSNLKRQPRLNNFRPILRDSPVKHGLKFDGSQTVEQLPVSIFA